VTVFRAIAFLVIATPALAEGGPTEAQREAFIAAITANDCTMTQVEAETKLPAVGIDKETSGAIAIALIDEGLAEVSEDGEVLTLKTEGCKK
jgi:hypothetical protein